ncbi:MAG: ion transporter [Eubacteriales bacterium]|nr:ion transporter [Eubacteriales bacterium]
MMNTEEIKKRIYEIIEVANSYDRASYIYDKMMLVTVIVGLIPLTMKSNNIYTYIINYLTSCIFFADYILRIYTSDYKMGIKYYKAYLYYAFTPLAIIDFLAVLPIFSIFFTSQTLVSICRLFRVVVVLKLIRYSKTMVLMTNVLQRVKRQLFAVLLLTIIYIASSAMFIFQLEPNLFDNFFDALYWATISITTIGYGDISPVTDIGRFITMISALVGVALIALPSGIVTAAYMDEVKKNGLH